MDMDDRNKCMRSDVSIELYGEIKHLMNEWVEESKKIINSKESLEKEVKELKKENEILEIECGRIEHLKIYGVKLEKEIERLKLELETANGYVDDVNENLAEIVEYRVNESMGEDYMGSEKSEIGILKNDIKCLEKEIEDLKRGRV